MDTAEKMLEYLKTPEGQEKTKKWAEDYKKQQEEKEMIIKKLLENDDYISWLERWTVNYSQFCFDDWVYSPDEISNEDLEKVESLNLLFEAIDNYAGSNFIPYQPCDFGYYYLIKYKDVGFQIGMMAGQGTVFFCKRVDISEECIDFKDIQINKKLEKVDLINNNLEKLADLINVIAEDGTPLDAIMGTTEKTVNKIKTKRKNN